MADGSGSYANGRCLKLTACADVSLSHIIEAFKLKKRPWSSNTAACSTTSRLTKGLPAAMHLTACLNSNKACKNMFGFCICGNMPDSICGKQNTHCSRQSAAPASAAMGLTARMKSQCISLCTHMLHWLLVLHSPLPPLSCLMPKGKLRLIKSKS